MNDYDEILEEQAQPQATTTQPRSVYDDVVDESAFAQERQLRGTVAQALDITPDRAAENQRLSKLTGIPPAIVNREFDNISKRVQIDGKPYEQIMRESPALTTWLTDAPDNAAIAQDDLENLGALEWLVTAPQRAFAQGMNQLEVARLRTKSMTQILTQEEQDMLNAAKYHMTLGGKNGVGNSWFRGAVAGLAGQLPILFGATSRGAEYSAYTIPAAFAFGTAATAAGLVSAPVSVPVMFGAGLTAGMVTGGADFGFEIEAGLAYDEFLGFKDELDQPLAPEAAKVAAITAGALNAGLEVVGLGVLAKTIPGVEKLTGAASRGAVRAALRSPTVRAGLFEAAKTYGGALAAETAVEVAQRGITLMSGELGKYASGQEIEQLTLEEFGTDLAHEAASALQTFSLLALPGPTLGVAVDVRRAKQAQQNEAFFKALGTGVTQSKTFERQPEAVQDFIARATKDGPIENVYAPIDTWTTYWQGKGLDPAEVATEVTGNPRAYAEAKATGIDLQIPTAAYAVKLAGTEHNTALAQELRLAPDAMNARESQEFIAEQQAAAAEAKAAEQPAADQVRAQVLQQLQTALTGTGIQLPAGALERYADVYQSFIGTMAEREGVDAGELFERYGLEVLGPQERESTPRTRPQQEQAQETAPTVDHLDSAVAAAAGVPNIPDDVREALQREGFVVDTGERRRATDATPDPRETASSFTPEAQKARLLELSKDPQAVAGGRAMMRRLGDINAARESHPREGGETAPAEGEEQQPAAAEPTEVSPQRQAQQMLDNAFPPGSAEREELVNLRKSSSPEDFKEFLQEIFTPRAQEETMGLHAVGDVDGQEGYAWGFYAASLRELNDRYGRQAAVLESGAGAELESELEGMSIEQLDVEGENASGESAASREALSRQEGMRSRGESFVVFNRAGQPRPLIGPDAVDYTPQQGETYGVLGPNGFRVLEDRGGRVPANQAAPSTAPAYGPGEEFFLSWELKASQQPPAVQQALRALGVRWTRSQDPTGAEVYRTLSRATDVDETGAAEASRVLNQHGVQGLVYSDAGLPNYISFDKSLGPIELWQSERPKGFDAIAQHLTPAERDKLKRDHAERLVAIFKDLPADQDFSEAALAGIAKRGWYRESAIAILNIFGNVDGPRFAALLAALSPQTSVESNLYNTVSTWKNWVKAGRPTDRAGILKVMARSVQGTKGADSVLSSWVPNAVRALTAVDPKTAVLSGPKVHSFYRNLIGEVNEVTNDAWMASFALLDKTILGGSINKAGTDPGKGPGYLAMVAKIRRVAKKLTKETGNTWTPDEVQETVWSWAKTLYELAEAEGTTAESIVREGRLSDDLIASTPDFKTLFTTDPTVRSLLEAAGYGDAISALESELGGSPDRDPGRSGGVEAGARTQVRPATVGTLRSARRLDALRRQRQEASRLKEGTELSQEVRPTFYSRVLDAVAQAQTAKASGAQWKATIKNAKTGVNADEVALTSVNDLEDGKTYTKDEVLEYLGTHQVKISQVVLGAPEGEEGRGGLRPALEFVGDRKEFERKVEERAQELYDQALERDREYAAEQWESNLRYYVEEETETIDDPDDPDNTIEESTWYVVAYAGQRRRNSEHARHDEGFATEEDAEEWLESQDGQEWKWELEDQERDDYLQDYEGDASWADAHEEAERELSEEEPNTETKFDSYVLKGFTEGGSYREAFIVADKRQLSQAEAARMAKEISDAHADLAQVNVDEEIASRGIQTLNTLNANEPDLEILQQRAPELEALHAKRDALRLKQAALRVELDRLKGVRQQEWVDGHSDYDQIERPIVRLRFNIRNGYSLEELEAYRAQAPLFGPRETLQGAEQALERINAEKKRILFLDEVQPPQPDEFEKMPALFQKNWREIAFKWALRYAAEHNLDAVAWTTGAQQADRYSLRKQVEKIEWTTPEDEMLSKQRPQGVSQADWNSISPDPRRDVRITTTSGNEIKLLVNYETGIVLHAVGSASQWAGEPLSAVMGSELAKQVIEGESGTIAEEGLEVGGVGLARLYDVDFRNVVNALPAVKKNKGKVGRFSIGIPLGAGRLEADVRDISTSPSVNVAVVMQSPNGFIKVVRPFQDRESAERWMKETEPFPGVAEDPRYIITRPTTEDHFESTLRMEGPNHSVVSEGGRWSLRQWHVVDADNVSVRVFQTRGAAEAFFGEWNESRAKLEPTLLQQGVALTDPIKAAVMGGQVLFQPQRSNAFKKWFGDSQVVDAQGQPLVVYHGTPADEFRAFRTPAYFAASEADAEGFGTERNEGETRVIPVYLRIENPVYIDAANFDDFAEWDEREVKHYRELGHDGAILIANGKPDLFVVFNPRQVKHAKQNSGAFSNRAQSMFDQPQRGNIRFGPDRQFSIQLFQDADVSTFMHESAHLFLEMLQDLALEPNASEQLSNDMLILRDQLFAIGPDQPIGVREHELFARAFEAYLMTGKAPSVGLRGVFNSFRAWLVGLYRTLAELDVTLTEDVRGVFDRMLASDRAIADAAAEFVVTPMFTTAESAGMTPEEFGRYQATVADASRKARETLEAKLLQEVRRAQTFAWRAQEDDTREEVRKEVHAQPVYQALAAMRRGTRPDGSPIVEGVVSEPLRLSRQIIVERYGEERLRELPRPYVYSVEGGLDPNVVAEMFGFSSGDALLSEITAAPPMNQAIDQETERRMRDRFGDTVTERKIPESARAALANDNRDEIVRAELRALGQLRRTAAPFVAAGQQDLAAERRERAYERRWMEAEAKLRIAMAEGHKQVEIDELTNEVMNLRKKLRGGAATVRAGIPSAQTLAEAARTRIGRTRVRDIKPQTFWSAAKRASMEATELAATGDFDGAIVAKQNELINLALYREAQKAVEQSDKRVRQVMNYGSPASRARLGRAGEDYLDQVDGILDRYDFARATQKVLDRRQALRQWVAQLEAQGLPVDLPDDVLDETRRMHYRELTFDELQAVIDSLQQIVHLARLKLSLLTKRKNADLQATVDTLVASIRSNTRRRQQPTLETRLPQDQALRMIDSFFAAHRKMASLAREMDGFEDGGAMWEAVILPLNDAADREAVMNAAATKELGRLVSAAYPGREKNKLYERTLLPSIGQSLTKMGRLMVALNWGNEGNRQRIMSGYGWNEQQVASILETLDQRDWVFVQGVWDFIDSYWEEIAAKQERVTGLAPEKVEAAPVRTKFGEMKGGYFPLKYDDRLSAQAGAHLEVEASALQRQAAYVSATTRRGHTKERMAKVTLPVRLDFGVIFEHVNQVIHDLSHHEAMIDIGRIMGNREVQAAIYDTYGDVVYKQFRGGLKDVAIGLPQATEAHEKVFNHLRIGSTIVGLGWNLTTAFLQPLGLTQSMVRIGPTWVAKGMGRWLRDAATMENTVAWISSKSEFMKLRGQTQQREINEIRNQVGINTGKVTGVVEEILRTVTLDTVTQTGIADSYFFLIQQMQRVADVPTWVGQYEKSMAAGETEERAIQLADQAVIDAQGGGQTKDLAAVQRGPAAWKLWTNFYSFFSTTYNLTAESTRRTKFSKPGQVGRLMVDYLLLYAVPATLGVLLRAAMKGEEPDEEDLLQELAVANVAYAMGTVMGLRELSGAVQGYAGYEGPAGARAFSSASRLITQVNQGEADGAFWRALNDTAGVLFHYPSGQVRRTIEGLVAMIEGRTKNPGVLVTGAPSEQ